jgi:hypothetical protein
MSAADALKVARAAGIQLSIEGDDLVLEASVPPTTRLLMSEQLGDSISWPFLIVMVFWICALFLGFGSSPASM